jgi:imidazolonepropionase-like amidohydrolase
MWRINETIFAAFPHYLAASGAPVLGTMPGISLHTELELLVRLGLSPREALAAATNNYALQFGWNELGQVAPGRRADIWLSTATPPRTSGTSAASPGSLWMATLSTARRC